MIGCLVNIFMLNAAKPIKSPNKDTQMNLQASTITKHIGTLQLNLKRLGYASFKGTSKMS